MPMEDIEIYESWGLGSLLDFKSSAATLIKYSREMQDETPQVL